ncbi:hypothetical protein [Kitasatospora sp. NPDC048407]|uniref:hypothetical protein n=1 Tax=Kitasatospora sp. NPDC048407 TaxID=3364051 RepID=UPI00370FDA6C
MLEENLAEVTVPPMPAEPPTAGAPAARTRRWLLPVAAGVAGVLVGAGGVGAAWWLSGSEQASAERQSTPKVFTLSGWMSLTGSNAATEDGSCAGLRGYDDISEGTAVTVYDATGQVVAVGALADAKRVGTTCKLHVLVPMVPTGPKFYQVEVGHRGKIMLSAENAAAGAFAASLG